MKYRIAWIFTKKGNLLPWLYSKGEPISDHIEKMYAREREIQLILLIRNESGHIYCRIKCPVSPLPIKGEFEVPCMSAIYDFLLRDGWVRKQCISASIFE